MDDFFPNRRYQSGQWRVVAWPEVTDSYYGSIIVITFALLLGWLRSQGVLYTLGLFMGRKQYWITVFQMELHKFEFH